MNFYSYNETWRLSSYSYSNLICLHFNAVTISLQNTSKLNEMYIRLANLRNTTISEVTGEDNENHKINHKVKCALQLGNYNLIPL